LTTEYLESPGVEFTIPGYRLLDRAGEGGMGTVYRARQLSLDRIVAVKVLHAAGSDGSVPAFQRESRLLASLSHPHIVAIHDCGEHDGRYYLVTEFITGSSLRSAMTPGEPWPIDRAAHVLDRIGLALLYIHGHGVLHLDLKPENVLCTPDGGVKIADFGLALARVDARELAERGLAQGTIDYCAPEQRYGLQADERSDLFSLAVLAYELLTGQLPGRIYRSAVRLNPKLPAAVDNVLRRALARRPEQRFATVAEFHQELQKALGPRRTSHRRTLSLVVLGLTLLLVPAGYFGAPGRPIAPPVPADLEKPRAWLIYDEPQALRWFGDLGQNPPPAQWASLLTRAPVKGRYPEGPTAPPLLEWPRPLPVLFLDSPNLQAFVHPLDSPRLIQWVWSHWSELATVSPIHPEDNFVRMGNFDGPEDFQPDSPHWRLISRLDGPDPDVVHFEAPPDRPDERALHLVKRDPAKRGTLIGLYQWLARVPGQPGTRTLLRFRARAGAETNDGRLLVRPWVPLTIPQTDHTPVAERLRALSVVHPHEPAEPGMDVRELRLGAWVKPGREWRTYLFIWDWPEYCTQRGHRNLEIDYVGLGEVWVDAVEMFSWDQGGAP
jgi:serine/threonine protein kinase